MGLLFAQAAKPGGDLLFHALRRSTIGAIRFHGRVRDGIGWVTDAIATKLWSLRKSLKIDALMGCNIGIIRAIADDARRLGRHCR